MDISVIHSLCTCNLILINKFQRVLMLIVFHPENPNGAKSMTCTTAIPTANVDRSAECIVLFCTALSCDL